MIVQELFIVLLLCFWSSASTSTDTKALIKKYEESANTSKILQKEDRRLITNWTEEYQVKRLDVSLKYRMQMVKHKGHSFETGENVKWNNCLYIHRKEIRRSESFYHDNELECLRAVTSKDAEKKGEVEQLEKQIAKWRKGYRYLVSHCGVEDSKDDESARQCLIQLMQNDKYDEVVGRLMFLKQTAMSNLHAYYQSSATDLEECLNTQLSGYLDKVREIMLNLNKCYSITS